MDGEGKTNVEEEREMPWCRIFRSFRRDSGYSDLQFESASIYFRGAIKICIDDEIRRIEPPYADIAIVIGVTALSTRDLTCSANYATLISREEGIVRSRLTYVAT